MTSKEVAKSKGDEMAIPVDPLDGLEDVSASDIVLPIIKINHAEGVFVDSLSNEQFEEFDCIMLGLSKGRVLWPSELQEETGEPLCKSYDFQLGFPGPGFVQRDVSRQFPSKVSGFGKTTVETAMVAAKQGPMADESQLLACGDCGLKEWETMPGARTPWCTEQFIFPVIRLTEDGGQAPAYITFQRSAMKACKAYISSFRQANRPMYTVVTTVRAIHQSRGTVEYVTPQFTKGKGTDPTNWPEYSKTLADIKGFLTTPRVREDDDDDGDDDEEDETPVEKPKARKKTAAKKTAAKAKEEAIETTATDADDEEPEPEPEYGEEDDETPEEPADDPEGADDEVDEDDDDEEPF